MALVGNQFFGDGSKPNASELNTVYNSVASGNISDDNAQVDWANRAHFSPNNRIVKFNTFDYDGQIDWPINNTTYTTIENVGGSPSQILPAYTTHGKALVRVHTSGLISTLTLASSDGNGTDAQIPYNTYALRLFMTLNGGSSTVTLANCTYSFTARAALTTSTSGLNTNTYGIQWRSFGLSGLYYLSASDVIDKIELQAKIGQAGNVANVRHNHIQLIVVEN
tara:strand:- start:680 stop:1348 length:669 start_codon:yes stop_codon:yes gene_type:complete